MANEEDVGYKSDTEITLALYNSLSFTKTSPQVANLLNTPATTNASTIADIDIDINNATALPPLDKQQRPNTTIYNLPSNILLHICSFLHQRDLVNLCLSSKVWSFSATSTLYSKVIVNDNATTLATVRSAITKYPKFFGTLISASNFQGLLQSICSNPSLGRLFKSLILDTSKETLTIILNNISSLVPITRSISPSPVISQPSSPGSPSSFVSLSSLDSLHTDSSKTSMSLHLTSLVAPDIPLAFFFENDLFQFDKITKLSVAVGEMNSNQYSKLILPNLQSLSIKYHDTLKDAQYLANLGHSLQSSGSLQSLRELEFSIGKDNDQIIINNILHGIDDASNLKLPTWLHFFESFLQRNGNATFPSFVLVLDSLAIEGHVGTQASESVQVLRQCIDLSLLSNLQLKVFETSLHIDNMTPSNPNLVNQNSDHNIDQFTDLITKETSSLVSLAINPTLGCTNCQMHSIYKTLAINLPQQLNNLSVVFESTNSETSKSVLDAICQSQSNLERLLIRDLTTESMDRSLLFKCIHSNFSWLKLYENGLAYEKMITDLLFSDIFLCDFLKLDEDFIVNDQMMQFIRKTSGRGLNEYLQYFFHFAFSPVVSSNFKLVGKFPKLKNLNVLGLSLSVNTQINKSSQEICYVANGRHLSTGLIFKR